MDWIINALIKPATARLGTAIGTYLTALGVAADDIGTVLAAVPVVVGVMVDLATRRILK